MIDEIRKALAGYYSAIQIATKVVKWLAALLEYHDATEAFLRHWGETVSISDVQGCEICDRVKIARKKLEGK